MAILKLPETGRDPIHLDQRFWRPRSAAELNTLCDLCQRGLADGAAFMRQALATPELATLSEPAAIASYRSILAIFDAQDIRDEATRQLCDLIARLSEPHSECMQALLDAVTMRHPLGEEASARLSSLARREDVPYLLEQLSRHSPAANVDSLTLSDIHVPIIRSVIGALASAADITAVAPLIAFWDRLRKQWWNSRIRLPLVHALLRIARRTKSLPTVDAAQEVAWSDYPDHGLDFEIGAARAHCGDETGGAELMVRTLDQSRSLEPVAAHAPGALVELGMRRLDLLLPYLDDPRVAGRMLRVVEEVLRQGAGQVAVADLQSLASRSKVSGLKVMWDTSKDLSTVASETLIPIDCSVCQQLAIDELSRRGMGRR
jgi:hypothetical protein